MEKHSSTQFDDEIDTITRKVLAMGGLVESQLGCAMQALTTLDAGLADDVMQQEHRIDEFEMEIDADCIRMVARRTPVASDLRFAMSVGKIVTNLERAGDEAERVAKRTKHLVENASAHAINISELKQSAEMAMALLRDVLDAFSKEDTEAALRTIRADQALDNEFRAFVRKLNSYMAEDPRCIGAALDFLTIAKAIERIGDHATNIAELVVYIVSGTDVRHQPRESIS